jgi:alpha-L-rhamnosidase
VCSSDLLTAIAGYLTGAIDPTTGLVTNLPGGGTGDYQYGIVDWPPAMRYGYDIGTAARTTINALAVNALHRVRQAGELLGRPAAELTSLHATETALIQAMNARLTRPDGTYVDGLEANGSQSHHVSEHANAEALAFGVVPKQRQPAVGRLIARLGMRMGPQTVQSLLDALHATNRDDALVRITTDPKHDGWAAIIAQGGTYTWESWILRDSEGDSESHAWGATVLVNLQQDILGVTPTSPGFATVDVSLPTGGLAHASGRIPTQQGPITVAWTRRGATTHLDLTIPPNEHASVHVSPTRVDNVGAGRWSLTISPR